MVDAMESKGVDEKRKRRRRIDGTGSYCDTGGDNSIGVLDTGFEF